MSRPPCTIRRRLVHPELALDLPAPVVGLVRRVQNPRARQPRPRACPRRLHSSHSLNGTHIHLYRMLHLNSLGLSLRAGVLRRDGVTPPSLGVPALVAPTSLAALPTRPPTLIRIQEGPTKARMMRARNDADVTRAVLASRAIHMLRSIFHAQYTKLTR